MAYKEIMKIVLLLTSVLYCGVCSATESSKVDFINSLDYLLKELSDFLPERELFLWGEIKRDESEECKENGK